MSCDACKRIPVLTKSPCRFCGRLNVEAELAAEQLRQRVRDREREALEAYADVDELRAQLRELLTPRPLDDWHEDYGSALWWKFPIVEAPYSGSPLDDGWPGYHTHWTPFPEVSSPVTQCSQRSGSQPKPSDESRNEQG
jgi:hypothetical protein